MPLNPATLTAKLLELDNQGKESRDIASAAFSWAEAWWAYASESIYVNPLAAIPAKAVVVPAFAGLLIPGLTPAPLPTFFVQLEAAMRYGWSPAGLGNPLYLLPPVPAIVAIIPAPAPFVPLGVTVAAAGLVAPVKIPTRIALAAAIDGWTRTHTVSVTIPPAGAVVTPLI